MTLRYLLGRRCALVALSATTPRHEAAFSALPRARRGSDRLLVVRGQTMTTRAEWEQRQGEWRPQPYQVGPGVNGARASRWTTRRPIASTSRWPRPSGTFDTPNQTVLVWSKSTITKDAASG